MDLDILIEKLKVESARIEELKNSGGLPEALIDLILGTGGGLITANPFFGAVGGLILGASIKDVKRKADEEYKFLYNKLSINKIGLNRLLDILIDLNKIGLSEKTPDLQQRLIEYILQGKFPITMYDTWMRYSKETLKSFKIMTSILHPTTYKEEDYIELIQNLDLWTGNLAAAAKMAQSQLLDDEKRKIETNYWEVDFAKYADDYFNPYVDESIDSNSIWSGEGLHDPFKPLPGIGKGIHLRDPFLPLKPGKKSKNIGTSSNYTDGTGSGFMDFASFFPKDIDTSLLPIDNDILSFVDNMFSSINQYSDQGFLSVSPDDLLSSSIPDYYNQFTLSDALKIPIQYNISIDGMAQVESVSKMVTQTTEAMNLNNQAMNDYTFKLSEQFNTLSEEEKAIYSVSAALSSLNGTYLGGVSSQIIAIADESRSFSDTLTDFSKIGFEIGGAFMGVDEEIGKAIGSAGGFAGGISNIFSAMNTDPLAGVDTRGMTPEEIESAKKQGEKQNGLALMSGIQGGFAGLQGLFGGEAGSDSSQLLGGMGGVGAGVAGLLPVRATGFFQLRLANT